MILSCIQDIQSLCDQGVAEGLKLEFKEKEDASTPYLGKNDKKNIARVVSSFANSDGGTLVYGVKTIVLDSYDVASELKPISNIAEFYRQFSTVCSLNISPDIMDLKIKTIDAVNGAGFLVCEVARSDKRPHMSVAPNAHTYYRRSFEGSVPMTPSEIRDQILAVRDAVLELVLLPISGGTFSNNEAWCNLSFDIQFLLKNSGLALCRNPFLRVGASCRTHAHSGVFDSNLNCWKSAFAAGSIIHAGDQEYCMSLKFNGIVDYSKMQTCFLRQSIDFTEVFVLMPYDYDLRTKTIMDKTSLENIELNLQFGAENSSLQSQSIVLSRREIAKQILVQENVKDMYMSRYGSWRADLIANFCEG